jgi:co-chaperonin GroES (HSP10)
MRDLGTPPTIRPHGDCILIRVELKESKLLLPEFVATEDHLRYIVESVGPGFWTNGQLVPLGVQKGDQVLLALSSLVPIWHVKIDEESGQPGYVNGSLFMVKVNSILGIVEKEAEAATVRLSDNLEGLTMEPADTTG